MEIKILIDIIRDAKCTPASTLYWYKAQIIANEENNEPQHPIVNIIEKDFEMFCDSLKKVLFNCNFWYMEQHFVKLWLVSKGLICENQFTFMTTNDFRNIKDI